MGKKAESDPNVVIKAIYDRAVPYDGDRKKRNMEIVERLAKGRLIQYMKEEDPSFKNLFQEIYHTGSYYDGLRVGDPDEFDLNLLLKLPISTSEVKLDNANCWPCQTRVFIQKKISFLIPSTHPCAAFGERLDQKLFEEEKDGKRYLRPDWTRQWVEGLVVKAVDRMHSELKSFNIEALTVRKAGPSMNLVFRLTSGDQIDVDVVPVFTCDQGQLADVKGISPELEAGKGAGLVPKPLSSRRINGSNQAQRDKEWRLDFHDQEADLIKGEVKPLIKLLKAFRNASECLSGLYSYCLKNLVMNMVREERPQFREAERGDNFLKVLEYLLRRLQFGSIPMVFFRTNNLLDGLHVGEIESVKGYLKSAIKKMSESRNTPKCKEVWCSYFGLDWNEVLDHKDEFQISVKTLNGRCITFTVEPTDLVEGLKEQIKKETKIAVGEQRLHYGGKQLQDGRTLSSYGIRAESTMPIDMCGRLRGGCITLC